MGMPEHLQIHNFEGQYRKIVEDQVVKYLLLSANINDHTEHTLTYVNPKVGSLIEFTSVYGTANSSIHYRCVANPNS